MNRPRRGSLLPPSPSPQPSHPASHVLSQVLSLVLVLFIGPSFPTSRNRRHYRTSGARRWWGDFFLSRARTAAFHLLLTPLDTLGGHRIVNASSIGAEGGQGSSDSGGCQTRWFANADQNRSSFAAKFVSPSGRRLSLLPWERPCGDPRLP